MVAADLRLPEWKSDYEDRLYRRAVDVSDEAAVVETFADISKETPGVDILINNAGIAIGGAIQDYPLATWNKVLAINTTGPFLCARETVRGLLARKSSGRIINIASIAGKNGFPNSPAYCASKAAVIGLTRSLAIELGPQDITVNAICPGSVDTPMIQSVIDRISESNGKSKDEVRDSMTSGIPMKRFQTPDDVANLCLFLASDLAKNINGESMNLDGGVVRD